MAKAKAKAKKTPPKVSPLVSSLKEMVACYGGMDWVKEPIPIIERAVKAIRTEEPGFKFEEY